MLEKYIPKRFATAMIKHVIAVTLFFPYFYTKNGNPAYADFVLPNFFAILTMVFILTSWKLEFKRNAIFVTGLSILLVAYNVCATYMNVKYHHWYGEQVNTSIAFLLFIVLLLVKDIHALIDTSTIKATIHMIVASNVLAIVFRLATGYSRLFFMNDWVQLSGHTNGGHQEQYSWVYGHKSEYGLILVLCVAFFVVYRKQFRNIFTYVLSMGVVFVALYISDSYTSLGAALLIFVGQFLDYLITAKWWKKLIATIAIPIPLIWMAKEFLQRLVDNRDIFTLGNRTYIWNSFIKYIKQNPTGVIDTFGVAEYYVKWNREGHFFTNNAHNIFLNHMLRFSIPVGGIFISLCVIIILFSISRALSFTTICIWGALFIPMMMDHSLTAMELSYVLVLTFIIFFIKPKRKGNQIKTVVK